MIIGHEYVPPFQILRAFLGPQTTEPVESTNHALSRWLSRRLLRHKPFSQWLKGELPTRAYLPFASEVSQAEIVLFFRSEGGEHQGGVMKVGHGVTVIMYAKC